MQGYPASQSLRRDEQGGGWKILFCVVFIVFWMIFAYNWGSSLSQREYFQF